MEDNDHAARLLDVQRASFRRDGAPDLAKRLDRLARLDSLVLAHHRAFAAAIDEDFGGRSRIETGLMEAAPVRGAIRHARRHLKGWMKPEKRRISLTFQPGSAWVRYQPLGVVGIVSPWNYPLQLALSPLVDILAAGNRAILKPSELTPHFSELLARAIADAFAEEEVAVVTGGPDVAAAFTRLRFDHLLFTGSTRIGREVAKAAAASMTPVTLELGGKSPAILCPIVDVARAARSIAYGKFVNAGQTCIAPDYVLAPEHLARPLAEAVLAEAVRAYPRIGDNPDYTALLPLSARSRLDDAVKQAEEAGAIVLRHPDSGAGGRYPPTIVLAPPTAGLLAADEIFGPVLPIIPYRTLDQAIALVGDEEHPLALYCFGDVRAEIDAVLSRTQSGGVTINGTLLHIAQEQLPFGGVGESGVGAYHGYAGFQRFSHARAFFRAGRFNLLERLGPPYGRGVARVLRSLLPRGQ